MAIFRHSFYSVLCNFVLRRGKEIDVIWAVCSKPSFFFCFLLNKYTKLFDFCMAVFFFPNFSERTFFLSSYFCSKLSRSWFSGKYYSYQCLMFYRLIICYYNYSLRIENFFQPVFWKNTKTKKRLISLSVSSPTLISENPNMIKRNNVTGKLNPKYCSTLGLAVLKAKYCSTAVLQAKYSSTVVLKTQVLQWVVLQKYFQPVFSDLEESRFEHWIYKFHGN